MEVSYRHLGDSYTRGPWVGSSELHGRLKIFDRKTCAPDSQSDSSIQRRRGMHSLYSCLDQKTNFCVASNFPGAVVYGTYDSHNIISQLGECSQNDALALNMNKILLSETDLHAARTQSVTSGGCFHFQMFCLTNFSSAGLRG